MLNLILAILFTIIGAYNFFLYGKSCGTLVFDKDSPSAVIDIQSGKVTKITSAPPNRRKNMGHEYGCAIGSLIA